ncbi:hypothetical protein ATANTOWER_025700 [Ataeniobius toweri]|uniref:Uncharacterized protein n=1 Tax=Ataeniobius toweri TaxID=208326 RepID=A0ABU7BSL1_9TELE|nr:hypothetical protein [Ataeniobius toweri]
MHCTEGNNLRCFSWSFTNTADFDLEDLPRSPSRVSQCCNTSTVRERSTFPRDSSKDFLCQGGAGAYLQPARGGGTPWTCHQSINRQPTMHTHTPKDNSERPTVILLDWEEAGELAENPLMHKENMQTPCRKTPGCD